MRIAFLGDIHANPEALSAVLDDCRSHPPDETYHTGDLVGYSSGAVAVLDIVSNSGIKGIRGNHEMMVLGELTDSHRTGDLRKSLQVCRDQLTDRQRETLKALPVTMRHRHFVMFHAMPDSPVRALKHPDNATRAAQLLDDGQPGWKLAVHGHMHVQRVFSVAVDGARLAFEGPGTFMCKPDRKYIVCPGSVGQPRDYDVRAGYMILDTDAAILEFRRVHYDVRSRRRANRADGIDPELVRTRLRETVRGAKRWLRRRLR